MLMQNKFYSRLSSPSPVRLHSTTCGFAASRGVAAASAAFVAGVAGVAGKSALFPAPWDSEAEVALPSSDAIAAPGASSLRLLYILSKQNYFNRVCGHFLARGFKNTKKMFYVLQKKHAKNVLQNKRENIKAFKRIFVITISR
jgi:hypothetical protein